MRSKECPLNNPFFKGYLDKDDLDWPISEGLVSCDTLNLSTPIKVQMFKLNDKAELAASIARFIGFHMQYIWPHLNGFPGYDTLRFEFKKLDLNSD